jgi:nucleotide-binding universal stress UspA family protein
MKKILIPTDFSKVAKNATKYILDLYNNTDEAKNKTFVLHHALHIPQIPSGGVGMAIGTANTVDQTKKRLSDERDYWREKYPELNIQSRFEMGMIESKIIELSEHKDIELIVVGSLGISGIERWLMKSSALDIAKNAEVPVMVIPEDMPYQPVNKTVFAADFNNLNILAALRPVKKLMETIGSDMTLLQIHQNSDESKNQNSAIKLFLKQYFGELNLDFDWLKTDHVADDLEHYFLEQNAGMMVIFDRDRNLFEELFHKDLTKKMIWQGAMPLLIIHEEDFSEKPELFDFLNEEIRAQIKKWQSSLLEIRESLKENQEEVKEQWKNKVSHLVDDIKDMESTIWTIEEKDEEKWEQLYKDLKSKMTHVRKKISELM